ncbi:hypothetical protein [Microbacterium pygmaeum]|uniref:Uncharacterized protein n=1 Tax=Microbacterium pygmaeum TaxID=370764 RepID=A0A1G7ZQL0_9MICO|nr:hypothetical protein [Microbacterium pygmaeum]SDH10949.1 hypothetical protein SAMN04489810_2133 [Microbacterium pygmaeum]
MPSVTDWISSISSLVGGLTGAGALVVAILSYLRSSRALAADAQTRDAVGATLDAMQALGRTVRPHATLDAGREPDAQEAFESAVREARRTLI